MLKNLKTRRDELLGKKQDGFTIVEVMIVLAIAGLIILIVFLAVPALQRNSRNTQRNNDISQIAGAVNECLGNRNGVVTSCNSNALLTPYLDVTKLRQLTNVQVSTAAPGAAVMDLANIGFNRRCNTDGSAATTTGATLRSAVILYNTENTQGQGVPRCTEI